TSKNINILNGNIRLHSFGSFKRLICSNRQHFSHYFNSMQYLDPQYLKNSEKQCFIEEQKKADIYRL
ncbi:13617_t:CDS:1, partial [Entrophospora sp. SA101]